MSAKMIGVSKDLSAQLERTEVEAWSDFCSAAPRDAVETCGLRLTQTKSSCFSIVPCVDTLAFNRVIGDIAPRASENRYLADSMEEAREMIAEFIAQQGKS